MSSTGADTFRHHLVLELRRHGIDPTPALVERTLRTHYASLPPSAAVSVSAPTPAPALTPAPASTRIQPEWSTYLADPEPVSVPPTPPISVSTVVPAPTPKPKPRPCLFPDPTPLTPILAPPDPERALPGSPEDELPAWSLDLDPSPIDLDTPGTPSATPVRPEPSLTGPTPPLYHPHISTPPQQDSDEEMFECPQAAVPPGLDPTSIDPHLVQLTLADQISTQLHVLQEQQARASSMQPEQKLPSAEAYKDSPLLTPIPPPPHHAGAQRSTASRSRNTERPSPEEFRALSAKEKQQLRNRISARNFRERRKEYITQLEDLLAQRDEAMELLRTRHSRLTGENERLKALVRQHGLDAADPASSPPAVPSTSVSPASPPADKGFDMNKILDVLRRQQSPAAPEAARMTRTPSNPVPPEAAVLNLSALNIPLSSTAMPSSPILVPPSSPRRTELSQVQKDILSSPRLMGKGRFSRSNSFVKPVHMMAA